MNCFSQNKTDSPISIFGNWKCVKHDYKGFQKFNLQQAEQIRNSVLSIENHTFRYAKAGFINKCTFFNWKISKYDTTESYGYSIEYRYTKPELAKMLKITPVDNKGNLNCYNECSTFFLKKDTLISICGGYTFYWVKIPINAVHSL